MPTSKRLYLTTKLCNSKVFEVQYGFLCNKTYRKINSYHAANSIQFMPEVIMCPKITYSVAMCNIYPVTRRLSWAHTRNNKCLVSNDCGMPVHSNMSYI